MAHAFAKVLPNAFVATYFTRHGMGLQEFATTAAAVEWAKDEPGITWLHLFERTTGRMVLTLRPPLKHEAPLRGRPKTRYLPSSSDERGRYRFELHADDPPFRIVAENFASRAERDEAAEMIARLLHLPLDLDQPEPR